MGNEKTGKIPARFGYFKLKIVYPEGKIPFTDRITEFAEVCFIFLKTGIIFISKTKILRVNKG